MGVLDKRERALLFRGVNNPVQSELTITSFPLHWHLFTKMTVVYQQQNILEMITPASAKVGWCHPCLSHSSVVFASQSVGCFFLFGKRTSRVRNVLFMAEMHAKRSKTFGRLKL